MKNWKNLVAGIIGGLALYSFVEVYCIPPIGSISTEAKATTLPFVGLPSNPGMCAPEAPPDVCLNQFILNGLNPNLAGLVAGLQAPFISSATTAQTFLSYVVNPAPASPLLPTYPSLSIGKVIRATVWGINGSTATANTITLNFGTTAVAVAVTGTSAAFRVQCDIQNVGTVASPQQQIDCSGRQGTTVIAATQANSAQALTSAITITLQSTNATASNMTVNGAYIEFVQ